MGFFERAQSAHAAKCCNIADNTLMDGATESETRPCGGECCTRLKRLHERSSPANAYASPSLSPSLS